MKPWLASEEEGTAAGDRTNCCAVAGATGDCKGTTLSPDEALKASYPVVLSLALSLSQSQCGVWPVLRPCLLELLLPRQGGSGSHSGTYRNWLCACGFALLFTIKVGWLSTGAGYSEWCTHGAQIEALFGSGVMLSYTPLFPLSWGSFSNMGTL